MASKDNSLTARVAVNRVWASLFGTGIDGRWHVTNHAAIWRCREANHPPIAKLAHADRLTARKGDVVQLNAERSSDPDGDKLSCKWFYYGEAGTFLCSRGTPGQPVPIDGFDQAKATFTVPTRTVMPPGVGTMHIVLAVTDHGSPRLTRYRRVIVDVKE